LGNISAERCVKLLDAILLKIKSFLIKKSSNSILSTSESNFKASWRSFRFLSELLKQIVIVMGRDSGTRVEFACCDLFDFNRFLDYKKTLEFWTS